MPFNHDIEMKLPENVIYIFLFLLIMCQLSAQAQDMVTSVGDQGLERTVSYNVASFTDIRDKKLEDVMSKMPGISVMTFEGSSSYSYNGMFIEKIYVNGLDILEGNYEPIYNMKPEDVERLEITENHVSMKVMKGVQYSENASINVVLKEGADSKWSGSVKGGLGFKPMLVNLDVNAINISDKLQTTFLLKADNTGLSLGGALNGFGGMEEDWMMEDNPYSTSGIDFSLKNFLNVTPTLAPLAPERVRFNRSAVANLGSTLKLNDNYQLNFQFIYHTDRLKASNSDEITYFMDKGETLVFDTEEWAKSHQNDIQADITLLSNTDKQYLRNQLSFATQWFDTEKSITGTSFNDQVAKSTPLLVKNNFMYKRLFGKNILTLIANAGLYLRPQSLLVTEEKGSLLQDIKSHSAFAELGASLDKRIGEHFTFSLDAGITGNLRQLDVKRDGQTHYPTSDINTKYNIFNAYGTVSLIYLNEKLEGVLKMPLKFGHYDLSDVLSGLDMNKSKLYWAPSLSLKYMASENLSLSLDAGLSSSERRRMNIYSGVVFTNYLQATDGYPSFNGQNDANASISVSFTHPHSSVFINGSLSYWGETLHLNPIMHLAEDYIVDSYTDDDSHTDWWDANIDISKGIESMKGKVGVSLRGNLMYAAMERNGVDIPYSSKGYTISPYINGRLNSWWNVVYKLEYNATHIKMNDFDVSTNSHSYTQTLEMIFSPWNKLNFSVLGEHYYTEFSDDVSKHLILFDCKAEYNLSDKWQLILSAKNILNQKTYNFTLADSEMFTKSYSSFQIRPRNILLSLYYKF